jgi:hypothetical protein
MRAPSLLVAIALGLLGTALHAVALYALLTRLGAGPNGAALICAFSSPFVYLTFLTFQPNVPARGLRYMRLARRIWSLGPLLIPALGIVYTAAGFLK